MPRARSGESWMCESWLDLPYSPVKAKPANGGGAVMTMSFTTDVFGRQNFLPIAYKPDEKMPGHGGDSDSASSIKQAGLNSSMPPRDSNSAWGSTSSCSLGTNSRGAPSSPAMRRAASLSTLNRPAAVGEKSNTRDPCMTTQRVSYVDPSLVRSVAKKPFTDRDRQKIRNLEVNARGSLSGRPNCFDVSTFTEGYVDHREKQHVATPCKTCYTKMAERDTDFKYQQLEKARAALKAEALTDTLKSISSGTASGSGPNFIQSPAKKPAEGSNFITEKAKSHRWFSVSEMQCARSAPTMTKRGFIEEKASPTKSPKSKEPISP